MLRLIASAMLVMLMLAAPNAGAAPILDNFTDALAGGFIQATYNGSSSTVHPPAQTGLAGVLGGTRDASVTSGTGAQNNTGAKLNISSGLLSFSIDAKVVGSSFNLTYSNTGPLNFDVAGSAFAFNVDSNDGDGLFTLTLSDGSVTHQTTLALGNQATGDQSIPVFGNSDFNGVNLGAVTSISFGFSSDTSADITLAGTGFDLPNVTPTITPATPVPEPTTLALWGAVSLGGVWYGRRKLQKANPTV